MSSPNQRPDQPQSADFETSGPRSAGPRAAPAQERVERESRQLQFLQSVAVQQLIAQTYPDAVVDPDSVTVEVLQHRPGAGVTAIYRVPSTVEFYVGITTEQISSAQVATEQVNDAPINTAPSAHQRPDSADTVQLETDHGRLTLWEHPGDPLLPGLALATSPAAVTETWGEGAGLKSLETISYRPLRRAVLSADFDQGTRVYLKVLRSGFAEDLAARHRMLVKAGLPAPQLIGEPVSDVVALRRGTGVSLAEHFLSDGAAAVRPADFMELLDALPDEVLWLPRKDAWTDRLPSYAAAAATTLPDCHHRIARLEQEVLAGLRQTDRGPVVPTHGDFYEANLLMEGPKISCLLDVDSLGPGHRVDDLACFLGHLAVLPAVDSRYIHAPAAFDRFARAFAETVDPEALRIRTSSVALSLVAGARSTRRSGWEARAEHRLRCAEVLLGLSPAAGDLPYWPAVL